MTIRIDNQVWSFARMTVQVTAACALCLSFLGCHHWRLSRAASSIDTGFQQYGDQKCNAFPSVSGPHYSRFVDEYFATREAIRRANRSLRQCYPIRPSFDFSDGYRQAFIDVALGGSGEIPSVPPERYWSTCYRTVAGHQIAQDWYTGYVAGAGRAVSLCRYQFNTVLSSAESGFEEDPMNLDAVWQAPVDAPSSWIPEQPPNW